MMPRLQNPNCQRSLPVEQFQQVHHDWLEQTLPSTRTVNFALGNLGRKLTFD